MTPQQAIDNIAVYSALHNGALDSSVKVLDKSVKALEIIKKHILDRNMDTSGIYLEYHTGYYEPYYTIEIKRGVKQIVSLEEFDSLKEVLL